MRSPFEGAVVGVAFVPIFAPFAASMAAWVALSAAADALAAAAVALAAAASTEVWMLVSVVEDDPLLLKNELVAIGVSIDVSRTDGLCSTVQFLVVCLFLDFGEELLVLLLEDFGTLVEVEVSRISEA